MEENKRGTAESIRAQMEKNQQLERALKELGDEKMMKNLEEAVLEFSKVDAEDLLSEMNKIIGDR